MRKRFRGWPGPIKIQRKTKIVLDKTHQKWYNEVAPFFKLEAFNSREKKLKKFKKVLDRTWKNQYNIDVR